MSFVVTDKIWKKKDKDGKEELRKGYYMDEYLAENMAGIPKHIKGDWDCIGIVSGSGKVRIAKSTIAMQIAYFVAWLLAGGKIDLNRESPTYGKVLRSPTEEVRFNLDNVCFDVETLMKKGHEFPKNSVLVYDEGREGLDAKSTMMNINRTMEQFLQQCGVYNHFVIVVLPDFFSLNKSFATARSNFLINVYHNEKYQRGFFNFYAEKKKEKLYVFGRKLLGNFARYKATDPDFRGKFTKWLPFDKEKYDELKRKALNKTRLGKRDKNMARQRDVFIYLYKKLTKMTSKDMSDKIFNIFGLKIADDAIRRALQQALILKEKKITMDEEKKEEEEE